MTVPQHTIVKSDIIHDSGLVASTGLGMLTPTLKWARVVQKIGYEQFKGARGDTVTFRVPARVEAHEYAFRNTVRDAITTDTLEQLSLAVTLDKMVVSAIGVTDEQLSLDIVDFSREVTAPQMDGVARKTESYIINTVVNADTSTTLDVDASDDPWTDLFIPARRALNASFVPNDERYLFVGLEVEDWLLTKDESFRRYDGAAQDGLDTLRQAILGTKAGFKVVGNNPELPEDFAVAMHPTAFGYVTGAPEVPQGAKAGGTAELDGYAMRWIVDYDADHLTDRSVWSTFAGTISVEDERNQTSPFALTGKNCRAVVINFFPHS